MHLSRRAVLAGAGSALATTAWAEPLATSMRPVARVSGPGAAVRMIAAAGLPGDVGFVIADAATGEVLDAVGRDVPLPPASVAKAFTALYAIEALGDDHRFETRVIADGPIRNGILDGNLILAGGGDPNLVTDQLAELASALKDSGLREVRGAFQVWDNALINLDEIDSEQLDYLGYNPTVTGLNLNFNRVHFAWKLEEEDFTTAMDARSENYRPAVTTARMEIVDRTSPVFTYNDAGGVDEWTVARRFLNEEGSRWLPVRHPALYAGEVFATFARSHGIVLKAPTEIADLPDGQLLAVFRSDPMAEMMRGMLRYSTNITAEAAGLSATQLLTGQKRGLRTSALGMARWATMRAGGNPYFVDHSGLGDLSRVTAGDMVRFLTGDGVMPVLQPIMRDIRMVDAQRKQIADPPGVIRAKTGTLNFVSSLAGYVRTRRGRNLAFAFFGADMEARERGKRYGGERPPGASAWSNRARHLQQQIVQEWARIA